MAKNKTTGLKFRRHTLPGKVENMPQDPSETKENVSQEKEALKAFSEKFLSNPATAPLAMLLEQSEVASYGVAYGGKQADNVSQGRGDLRQVINATLPTEKRDQIERAYEWASSDDLLSTCIDIKTRLICSGFSLRCEEKESSIFERFMSDSAQLDDESVSENEERISGIIDEFSQEQLDRIFEILQFQEYINQVQQKWQFYRLVKNLTFDYITSENMILYWKGDEQTTGLASENDVIPELHRYDILPGINSIVPLSPLDADYEDSLGVDLLMTRIPDALRKRIETALTQTSSADRARAKEELIREGIPQKWIDAVESGDEFVPLNKDEGDQWIVQTAGRQFQGLSAPSMFVIFMFLEIRDMLRHGDFAASYMSKHFIFQAKTGESIDSGPMAGMKNNWATPIDIQELYTIISSVSQAIRIATNHTVKFEFIFPPSEMFSKDRYQVADNAIHVWTKVPEVLTNGSGTYASGHVNIKPLIADIVDVRRVIDWTMKEFFDHETIRSSMQSAGNAMPEGCTVSASFDENFLEEPGQILNELKFLDASGAGDPEMSLRELGRNPSVYRVSKLISLIEQKRLGMHRPIKDIESPDNKESREESEDEDSSQNGPGRPATSENPDERPRSGSPTAGAASE